MPTPITDEAFEFLLARAGLTLTDAEKADLRTVVRRHRGDGRAGPKAARHHGRTGADLRLCPEDREGRICDGRDPDDRRGGPADRREGAVAGRVDKGLPRSGPGARQPAARLLSRHRGAGAGRGAGRRDADHGARPVGAAARHPDRPQGHRRYQGHPDDLRVEAAAGQHPGRGRDLRRKARRCRHRADRQIDDARIRRWRPLVRPARAAGAQSVEPRAFHRRQQQRHRRGGRRRHDPVRHRHRYRRLDPRPAALVRHRRAEADLRSGQPRRRRAGRLHARPYRPDGVDRRGLRDHAAGARRPRPARPGERRPADPRLPRRARRRHQGAEDRRHPPFPRDRQQGRRGHPARHHRGDRRRSAISAPRSARCSCRHCRIGRPAAR